MLKESEQRNRDAIDALKKKHADEIEALHKGKHEVGVCRSTYEIVLNFSAVMAPSVVHACHLTLILLRRIF